MPSVNPRLALALPPHRHELLKRLAALQGVPMSAVVSELLEECYPVLERVCVALEAAKRAQETSKQGLRDAMASAEAELLPLVSQAANQFDMFMDQVTGALGVETGRDGAALCDAAARRVSTAKEAIDRVISGEHGPRPVIRGSGLPVPPPKSQGKKPAKPLGSTVSPNPSRKSSRGG